MGFFSPFRPLLKGWLLSFVGWSLVGLAMAAQGVATRGDSWSVEDEEAFKTRIRTQYEREGHPYFASARLWDDGVIDPADTRRTLALAISASLNQPIEPTRFGVFRM